MQSVCVFYCHSTLVWTNLVGHTTLKTWGVYTSHIHWSPCGTGTPKDRDEVNRREVWECEGWVCDEEAIGVSSIFKAIRSAAACWPPVVFVYQSIIKSIQFLFIMKRQSHSYIEDLFHPYMSGGLLGGYMSGGLFCILFPIGVFQFSMFSRVGHAPMHTCFQVRAPHTRKHKNKHKNKHTNTHTHTPTWWVYILHRRICWTAISTALYAFSIGLEQGW